VHGVQGAVNTRRANGLSLLPTAILFGMGVGNLWGLADLFMRLTSPEWMLLFPAICLAVLVAFLTGVARAWWQRGAAIPMFMSVVAAWVFGGYRQTLILEPLHFGLNPVPTKTQSH